MGRVGTIDVGKCDRSVLQSYFYENISHLVINEGVCYLNGDNLGLKISNRFGFGAWGRCTVALWVIWFDSFGTAFEQK